MRDFFKFLPVLVLIIGLVVFSGVCYIGNIVKLVQCDWKGDGNWKGEIIHGIGVLIPPAAYVTFWFDDK